MYSFLLPKTHFRQCTCGGRDKTAAKTPPAAAVVTKQKRHRQQHAARLCQQIQGRGHVVARVRIEDLEQAQGPVAAAEALQAYMQLEQSCELNSVTAGNIRLKYGIRRAEDSRVQLRRADGTWMQAKLDMEVRGTILLRSIADDTVWVLQTDRVEQVDLSDDYLLFMLFADGSWEEQIQPIQILDENGQVTKLEMGEQQFKDYVGLLKTLEEASKEAQGFSAGRQAGDEDGAIDVTAEVAPSSRK